MPTYNVPKIGTRGSDSYNETGERPNSWREGIMFLDFAGMVPMNALMAGMKGTQKDDATFNWYTEAQINRGADLSGDGVYTDLGFGTALSADNTSSGSELAARCSQLFANYIRKNHVLLIRNSLVHSSDIPVRVLSVVRGTDSTSGFSFVTLKDDTNVAGESMADADRVIVIGSAHAEGANRPESISYVPNRHWNNTQIFRTPLKITRTAKKTRYRTGDAYMKLKRDAFRDHIVELEDAFLWGERTEGTDDNGEPIRTTRGMINWIMTDYPTNALDYRTDTDYSGLTWDAGGQDFVDEAMRLSFRWGNSTEKICFTGDGGMAAIQRLVRNNAMYTITAGEKVYGIEVATLRSIFGKWHIKTHPRFTHETSNTNSMLVFEKDQLHYNYIDDTYFMTDAHFRKGGGSGFDGLNEEYLTECGLEFHHPEKSMYLSNLGVTNVA